MPVLNQSQLFDVANTLLSGAGVPAEDAKIVAQELSDANIVGHDSHGIMRLMQYVDFIRDGHVKIGGEFEIVRNAPAFAVVDGNFNFGQVTARKGLALGIEKARSAGTATIMMRNCNHVGRLGAYTQDAANRGFAAIMAVNAPGPGGVAPFGGMERRLGTNPISMSGPSINGPLVLDMTTSATAEGKLRVAKQSGKTVPDGMIIDGYGKPSCDPNAYYDKPFGSILPLGGPGLGHKGYGLSVMVDVFCGMLSGSGVCRTDLPRGANGVWLHLMDVEQFLPRDEYDEWMSKYVSHLKDCPRLPGVDEILLPGELEERVKQQRSANGVEIPPETWRQISELAASLNVSLDFAAESSS
ncbi:Ldh family oxidoreductase [Thalassoglobus sp. JC818]|uniref:Ldh family oxidoreductase n=1 Tax=Thalassoglobus sp. JC818 TaxID=3232136 RepID=UPI0034584F25